ncbi:MAG: M23 family metallopeptidase [Gemmatimonadota bacterium]
MSKEKDERHLSLIIVPHGDLETRTYDVSYPKLKVLLGAAVVLLVVFVVMVSSWWYVAAQAARVPGLERDIAQLETERAKVTELAQTLAQVEAQYQRVRQALGVDAETGADKIQLPPLPGDAPPEPGRSDGARPTAWPLTRAGLITRELVGTDASMHPGLDIAVPTDSYIRAAGSGVVKEAGTDDVYGRYVLIDHGNGLQSLYGHASRIFVKPGEHVERLEVIALSGSTGRSTGPHLHFEIRNNGEAVDPLAFVHRP